MKKGAILLLVVFIFLIFTGLPGQCASSNEYWPDDNWRTSTPEEQGIDSSKLVDMLHNIENSNLEIRSLLIIRHGYLVTECYREPYTRDTAINVKSVCKSIISTLTGIALREKYLQNLDQKVLGFFPEYKSNGKSLYKDQIALGHLLTMTAGLAPVDDVTGQWSRSKDWVKFVLDQPEKTKPGEVFTYNTGLTHVMSALITKTSGMSTLEFGRKYLFDPLGIKIHKWTQDSRGIYIGGAELSLTPIDMAKLGYLYLQNGRWNGIQIVPEAWVKESTKNQLKNGTHYGYWWWISPKDYWAEGWGGQYILVNPILDLVLVFTAADFDKPAELWANYIYPAFKSQFPIPPNPAKVEEMNNIITALAHPKSNGISPSPELIQKINGKNFYCQRNPLGLSSVKLSFKGTHCTFKIDQWELTLPMGQGTYHLISLKNQVTYFGERPLLPVNDPQGSDSYQAAFRCQWLDDHTLQVEWINYLEEPIKSVATFAFENNQVEFTISLLPKPWGGTYLLHGSRSWIKDLFKGSERQRN